MPFKTRLGMSGCLLAAALAVAPAIGQIAATQPAAPRGGLNPDSFYGKESNQGVSVRDSLEAVKKIEDARRMERLQDWNKAADWYQEVIEKYGQYVVPSGMDAEKNIRQYTGIERPVQEQLSKWPKEGLDAYRNRYGAIAATMLEQAGQDDRETLSRVMKLYFVSESGKQAGIRLMDLLLESGEFAEAARVGDRLLDWHPTLVVERPKVLFRTALAYHLSGDEKKSVEREEQLKNKHAGAVGTLFGKDIVLGDALERLLKVTPPVSVATAIGSVRMNPGGDESRSMISAATGRPGARLATIDYTPLPTAGNSNGGGRRMRGQFIQDDGSGNNNGSDPTAGFGVLPVADAGELYFQDGSRIYAVSLQSGVPLPGWIQTYPNSNGQYSVKSYGNARSRQHTLTLTDNSVLAVMGYSDRLANYYGSSAWGEDRGTRLVSLDRATGKEKWTSKPGKIREENLQALDLSGSPLVVGDNVYVIGRGGKNPTSEDCYVLCFDLNNGNYKWSCFIASSSSGYNQFTGQYGTTDSLSHLAYSSGRIYILTNLGAAAAIDAYSGTISWLNIYPRDVEQMNPNMAFRGGMGGMQRGSATNPWEFNPVVVQDGRIFILPTDSKFLMVYDASSGAELKRIETAELRQRVTNNTQVGDNTAPVALLAVDGNQVFLSGGTSVYCIDWTPVAKPEILWHCGFASRVIGRGFVTSDSVFVCTEAGQASGKIGQGGIHRIERLKPGTKIITGMVKETYPKDKDWDEGEGPGNIIVVGDQVVVAGSKRLNVYADLVLARKRLDDDVAAAPNDPEPYLRYAEVMFVAGQLKVAMEKINLAVTRLGGLNSMRPGPEREHLFSDCLTFAAKLQKDIKTKNYTSEQLQGAIDSVTPLYDLAAAAADGDAQQVNYRMSRAKFDREFEQDDSKTAAVTLYQEILNSQKLRVVPLTDESGLLQAADVAEKMIAEVKKEKPKTYEKFEKEASEAMQAAGSDPALLKSVADTYPNSAAAPQAMTRAAGAFEAQDNFEGHRLAALMLQKVCKKYGDSADMMKILEAMARNYLAMPETSITDRAGTASGRLSKIVKMGGANNKLSKALMLPDKKVLVEEGTTINDAWKKVQHYKAEVVSAKLPDLHISPAPTEAAKAKWEAEGSDPAKKPKFPNPFLAEEKPLVLDNVGSMIKPMLEIRQQTSRYDRVVTWFNGNLSVYAVGEAKPLGTFSELAGEPKNLAWLDSGASLLVWSDTEMVLLDGANAAKKWKITLKSLPKIDVVAGGAADENMTGEDNGNVQIINNGVQRIVIRRQIVNGRVMNINQGIAPPPAPGVAAPPGGGEGITSVHPVDDKIVVATTSGQLFALHTNDGKLAWHQRLSANGGIARIAATDDFVVAKVDDQSTTQLVAVNTYDGQLVKRMSFSNDSGSVPVNFALAPDGTLVWIQPDRLCGKDLFDPRKEPNYEIVAGQADNKGPNVNVQMNGQGTPPIYGGATNPDQLVISEGRILVVNNNGKYVSAHSLENGMLLDHKQPNGLRAEARLSTISGGDDGSMPVGDWGVGLHVVGSKLYICTRQNGPVCYNLDNLGVLWGGTIYKQTAPSVQFQEPFIGQDYLALVDRATASAKPGANAGNTLIRFNLYNRSKLDGNLDRESGRLDYFPVIRDEAGITDVQGVDGGFYYLTGDKKLHFLRGGRK